MRGDITASLTEAIYDAAVEPAVWSDVMATLKREFGTGVEGLYGLDLQQRRLRAIRIQGVDQSYIEIFRECYYRNDNPCIRSEPLHRPGFIRTDQKLAAFFNDSKVLHRSVYYNEWMRPQDLEHTLGTTLSASEDSVIYFTLLRPRSAGPFSTEEEATFARLGEHLRRSLRLATQLGTLETLQTVSLELLDANPAGVVLLDQHGRTLYANRAGSALASTGDGFHLASGGPALLRRSDNEKLAGLIGRAAAGREGGALLALRPSGKRAFSITVSPLSPGRPVMMGGPAVCLVIADPEAAPSLSAERLRQLYGLTPAEAALTLRLLAGDELRGAADNLSISYATARTHLIAIFRKTDTRRQGELMKLLMGIVALPDLDAQDVTGRRS